MMSNDMLTLLKAIEKNTQAAGRRTFLEEQESAIVKQASAFPLKLFLGIPLLLTGVLPLLFNYGSQVAPAQLAPLVGTFFGLFFTVPTVLLSFRIRKLGLGWLGLYTVSFAAGVFTLFRISGDAGVGWLASVSFALVFGIFVPLVMWRSWRQFRRDWIQWWMGLRADLRRAVASRVQHGEGARPRFIRLWLNFNVERRKKARFPSVPLALLALVHTAAILALFHVPHVRSEWRLPPFGGTPAKQNSVPTNYATALRLIPAVTTAKERYDRLVDFRAQDSAAVPLLLSSEPYWNTVQGERDSVWKYNGVLLGVARRSADSARILMQAAPHDSLTWKARLARMDTVRFDAARREALGTADTASKLTRLRGELRPGLLAVTSGRQTELAAADQAKLRNLEELEKAEVVLGMHDAERATKLLTADGILVTQQGDIVRSLNSSAQRELARIVNNVRVAAFYIFLSALLVCVAGWWASTRVERHRTQPQGASRYSWLRYRKLEARRRGTYILGTSLLFVFMIPLLQPIKPEKLNLSQPFTPFILPAWFLPSFAQQHVIAPVRGMPASGGGTRSAVPSTTPPSGTDRPPAPGTDGLKTVVADAVRETLRDTAVSNGFTASVRTARSDITDSVATARETLLARIGALQRHIDEEAQ
jgi:hypothetical protein